MQHQLHEIASTLNRISRLYSFAIRHSSPYRLSRMRMMFENELQNVSFKFEINDFNTHDYQMLFEPSPSLQMLAKEKQIAIDRGDYELAASLRDQEKSITRTLLASIGVEPNDEFFIACNSIYRIRF